MINKYMIVNFNKKKKFKLIESEGNLLFLSDPLTVVGDIHG